MAARLLQLDLGIVSLEFDRTDMPDVRKAIQTLFEDASESVFVLESEVEFGRERFAFQNEWDDPCLISKSARGSQILKQLHDALTPIC